MAESNKATFLRDVLIGPEHRMGFGTPSNLFRSFDMPTPDQRLIRCISVGLFEAMARKQGLNFTRFDKFIDEFDGAYPPFECALQLRNLDLSKWAQPDEVSRRFKRITSVSCWTMNENISEGMFELMDRNGGIKREVALISSLSRVCDALKWPDDVSREGCRGPVLYCDGSSFDVMQNMGSLRAFFWKEDKWKEENEYRFVYHPDCGVDIFRAQRFSFVIDEFHWMRCCLADLIDRVVIRRSSSAEVAKKLKDISRALGIGRVEVSPS
jgi:hypothetical protein